MPTDLNRIFVVGCPRSGTTLVQSLLAAHPEVISFTESHFFDRGFRPWGRSAFLRVRRLRDVTAKFVNENQHIPEPARRSLLACHTAPSAREAARSFIAALDETARAQNATCWVEKTPDHVFRISLIRSAAPTARFIHVVRRAEAVMPSLYRASRQWGRGKSWLNCGLHWTIALWISALRARGPRHLIVPYEALLREQRGVTQGMFRWLGLEWDDRVLTDYPEAAVRCLASSEVWKSANLTAAPPAAEPVAIQPSLLSRFVARSGPYGLLLRRWRRG